MVKGQGHPILIFHSSFYQPTQRHTHASWLKDARIWSLILKTFKIFSKCLSFASVNIIVCFQIWVKNHYFALGLFFQSIKTRKSYFFCFYMFATRVAENRTRWTKIVALSSVLSQQLFEIEMDWNLWGSFGRKKTLSYNLRNMVSCLQKGIRRKTQTGLSSN